MSQNESETENLRHPKKKKGKWDYYFKTEKYCLTTSYINLKTNPLNYLVTFTKEQF